MDRIVPYILFLLGLTVGLIGGPTEVESLMIARRVDSFEPTEAEVTARFTRKHPKGPATEVVEFAYEVDGRTYRGDNHLTSIGDSAQELNARIRREGAEQTIEVFYDPAEPSTAVVHRDVNLLVPLGILGGSLFCVVLGGFGILDERRNRKPKKPIEKDWPEHL